MPIGLTGNDFWPLRAQQLYDPNRLNAQADNAPPDVMSIQDRIMQMAQPQTDISDAYKQSLMNMPQPESAGKLRTIAAVLAGLGAGVQPSSYSHGAALGFQGNPKAALETTDLVKNAPFYRQMDQYNARNKALGTGAQLEERQNAERARTAETTLLRERQQTDSEEKARANQEKERLTQLLRDRQQQDSDTRLANSKINEFKAKNPHSIIKEANSKLIAINPLTNETQDLGIETGKLDDATKLHIQLQNQLAEIEARTQGQIKVEGVKAGNRQTDISKRGEQTLKAIEARGAESQKTKQTPTAAQVNKPVTTAKAQSPTQDKVAVYNRAQQVLSQHPEWQKYFHLGAGNTVVGSYSSLNPFHNKDEYNKAYQAIYGTTAPPETAKPKILSITPVK